MKKTVLILAPLLLAALLLVLAAQLWLRPQVENQARQALAGLTSFDGSPVQSSVEVLDFSPLTRKLLLRGLELRMVQPQGPVTYQAAEISLRLPLRAMLACTPLRGAVLPEQGMTTVAEGLLLLNVSARTSLGKVVMQREEVDALYADSALLRELAEGAKLPDSPGLTYRMGADNIRASFISVDIPTVNQPLYISIKEAGLRNWRGRHMEEAALTDLRLRIAGQDGLILESLSQSGIVLPEEALLRRLSRLFGAPPDQRNMQALFQEMLAADEPLFRELRLNGLTMPLPEDRAELKTGSFEWLSNRPARYRINLSGLSLPAVLQGYGLALPGLDTIRLDADISVEEQGQDSILEKGMVKATNVGDLRYSLLISGNTEGMDQQQALFSQTYGDLKLRFEDHGLMGRLALMLPPDGRAAAAVFTAAVNTLCVQTTSENKALAAALETFANRPGSLELSSTPGRLYSLTEVLGALAAGNPGALFRAEAQPGAESLEQQAARINAGQSPQP